MPDAAPLFRTPITTEITLDHISHELRRALSRPILRICKGGAAPAHEYAVAQGWFAPLPEQRLQLTDLGLKLLAEDQCRNGLRDEETKRNA